MVVESESMHEMTKWRAIKKEEDKSSAKLRCLSLLLFCGTSQPQKVLKVCIVDCVSH